MKLSPDLLRQSLNLLEASVTESEQALLLEGRNLLELIDSTANRIPVLLVGNRGSGKSRLLSYCVQKKFVAKPLYSQEQASSSITILTVGSNEYCVSESREVPDTASRYEILVLVHDAILPLSPKEQALIQGWPKDRAFLVLTQLDRLTSQLRGEAREAIAKQCQALGVVPIEDPVEIKTALAQIEMRDVAWYQKPFTDYMQRVRQYLNGRLNQGSGPMLNQQLKSLSLACLQREFPEDLHEFWEEDVRSLMQRLSRLRSEHLLAHGVPFQQRERIESQLKRLQCSSVLQTVLLSDSLYKGMDGLRRKLKKATERIPELSVAKDSEESPQVLLAKMRHLIHRSVLEHFHEMEVTARARDLSLHLLLEELCA